MGFKGTSITILECKFWRRTNCRKELGTLIGWSVASSVRDQFLKVWGGCNIQTKIHPFKVTFTLAAHFQTRLTSGPGYLLVIVNCMSPFGMCRIFVCSRQEQNTLRERTTPVKAARSKRFRTGWRGVAFDSICIQMISTSSTKRSRKVAKPTAEFF